MLLLTPAPDQQAVAWKRRQLEGDKIKYLGIECGELKRAIAEDVTWLKTHPTRTKLLPKKRGGNERTTIGRTPRFQRSPTGPNGIDRRTARCSRRSDEMAGSDTPPRFDEVRQKAPTRLELGTVGGPGKGTATTSIARHPRRAAMKRRRRINRKKDRQRLLAAHARSLRR
jgi:hypothetical protein